MFSQVQFSADMEAGSALTPPKGIQVFKFNLFETAPALIHECAPQKAS